MDKLQIIENIIKYLPVPAFVIKDAEAVLKNERAKKIELPDIKEKLSLKHYIAIAVAFIGIVILGIYDV